MISILSLKRYLDSNSETRISLKPTIISWVVVVRTHQSLTFKVRQEGVNFAPVDTLTLYHQVQLWGEYTWNSLNKSHTFILNLILTKSHIFILYLILTKSHIFDAIFISYTIIFYTQVYKKRN